MCNIYMAHSTCSWDYETRGRENGYSFSHSFVRQSHMFIVMNPNWCKNSGVITHFIIGVSFCVILQLLCYLATALQ